MGLLQDLERWVRNRALKLPARWNSIDDITSNMDAALKQRGFEFLTDGLRAIFSKIAPLTQVKAHVWRFLETSLDLHRLPDEQRAIFKTFVFSQFGPDDTLVEIEAKLLAEIRKGLKL